jgi:hypothetical protein
MTLDISGDYAIFDGGEVVTLRQIRPDGATSVTVDNAVSGPVDRRRAAMAGIDITGDERSFSLNATQPGARGVQVDDIVIDSTGERWRVLSTSLASLDARWIVLTRKQV